MTDATSPMIPKGSPSSDAFSTALDLLLQALKTKRDSGSRWKASASALARLQSSVPPLSGVPLPAAAIAPIPPGASVSPQPPPTLPTPLHAPAIAYHGDKTNDLQALRSRIAACAQCPNLAATRTQTVFGRGNPNAELMLVGEAPGADEDRQGEPFVGAAGELLEKMLRAMGFSREDVYIANVLKCRPDLPPNTPGNRKPTPAEMERCLPYLREQIRIVQPKVMVALGATAMQGLFGRSEPMAKLRSQWYSLGNIPVMATYHPSYLLRNQAISERRKVWEDLLQVLELLHRPISDKQRGFFLTPRG